MKPINIKVTDEERAIWKKASEEFGRRTGKGNPDRCMTDFIRHAVRLEVDRLEKSQELEAGLEAL